MSSKTVPDFNTFAAYLDSWRRSLRAENKSDRTIETYSLAAEQLAKFALEHGLTEDPRKIRRRDIEDFITHMRETRSAATARQRYSSLRNFFNWLTEEEELKASPMAKMRPPKVEEKPPKVLTDDELRTVLSTTVGTSFPQRRDAAILRLFIDTGARLSEITNLKVAYVDLDLEVAYVEGKGRKHRSVPFGRKTTQALDRYLRSRASHPYAAEPWLWVGKQGRLRRSGVFQVVRRRGRQASIDHLHPHLFRHTMAHRWLAAGGQEHDLIRIAGWSDTQMLSRYGASAAAERARTAHKRLGLGDQL